MKLSLQSSLSTSRLSLAILGVLLVMPATTHAADQMVLGSKLQISNPGAQEKRKISLQTKEKASANTIVGDPVANGATLNIRTTGNDVDGQTFNLPSANWTGDPVKGFKYKDAHGVNGPVASVQLSDKGGTFAMKVSISGKLGLISILPPNPGADGCALFTINGGGDDYSVNFATGVAKNKGAKGFSISKPTSKGSCVRLNPNSLPVKHVVLLMQENRSADTYLGQLSTQGQPAYEPEPNTGNPDPTNPMNPPITPFHKTNYCEVADLDHSWKGTHNEVHNGLMDGFTNVNKNAGSDPTGSRTMGYYDQTDLPFYYGLYSTFATGDRYFSSVQTQTYPNRLYFLAGTSYGHIRNDIDIPVDGQSFGLAIPSVFNLLDQAGVTWRIYAEQPQFAYASIFFQYVFEHDANHVVPGSQFFTDLANGTLPEVAYVDPDFVGSPQTENDEHPISDVQIGQKFVADHLNALMTSSAWATSAFFLSYDEHGGFYDHVPPPAAPVPDGVTPIYSTGDQHELFDEYGVRVPVVVASPWSKPAFVSHVIHDHTSQLRFVEERFGLPSLTNRDAAADPMLEFFDFNTATFATPPSLPAAVIDPGKLAACPG